MTSLGGIGVNQPLQGWFEDASKLRYERGLARTVVRDLVTKRK